MKENRKLLKEVLRDIQHDMTDEEVLNLLADSKISESPATEKYTLGQRAADAIAKFAGSWAFIFSFTGVLILWMVVNTILASNAFDPYPFILLNLVLSCVAAIQAPLIMMSQNRREEKDRRRAENDYKVNLKTEIMIEDLYDLLPGYGFFNISVDRTESCLLTAVVFCRSLCDRSAAEGEYRYEYHGYKCKYPVCGYHENECSYKGDAS